MRPIQCSETGCTQLIANPCGKVVVLFMLKSSYKKNVPLHIVVSSCTQTLSKEDQIYLNKNLYEQVFRTDSFGFLHANCLMPSSKINCFRVLVESKEIQMDGSLRVVTLIKD
jgi:hypothetical protein